MSDEEGKANLFVPTRQLGSGTSDSSTFLRGDSTWADPEVEFSPEDFLELLIYAFQRIEFLEKALSIKYGKRDLEAPEPYSLIQERVSWK